MRHERVIVVRDERTRHNNTLCAWEIPILEYMFGEGSVTRTGEYIDLPDREYPDPNAEMERLSVVYGKDPDTKVSNAVTVFGAARKGVRELARLIQTEMEAEEGAKKPKSRKVATAARRSAAASLLN